MSDEDIAWAIAVLEREIEWQDSEFRRRFQQLERDHAVNAVVVGALFGLATVLLVLGLSATSFALFVLGLGSLGLSAGIHRCYRWRMRRAR